MGWRSPEWWADCIVDAAQLCKFVSLMVWLGVAVMIVLGQRDRAYMGTALVVGIGANIIVHIVLPRLGSSKTPLGQAVLRETKRRGI